MVASKAHMSQPLDAGRPFRRDMRHVSHYT
jgi:hypothetical protein